MKPFGSWFAESADAASKDSQIPLKEIAPADYLVAALQEIIDSSGLDCGCVPCMGACWDKDSLRDEIIHIRETAVVALHKYDRKS